MYVGLRINRNGKYACLFCTHKAWKGEGPAMRHVDNNHMKERAKLLADKLQEAQNKPPRTEYREKVVYKDRPEPEYKDERIDIYCTNCCIVMTQVRLPRQHSISTTSCNKCGLTTLRIVSKII